MTERRNPRAGDRVYYESRDWRVIETDKNDVYLELIHNRKWVRMDRFTPHPQSVSGNLLVLDWVIKP